MSTCTIRRKSQHLQWRHPQVPDYRRTPSSGRQVIQGRRNLRRSKGRAPLICRKEYVKKLKAYLHPCCPVTVSSGELVLKNAVHLQTWRSLQIRCPISEITGGLFVSSSSTSTHLLRLYGQIYHQLFAGPTDRFVRIYRRLFIVSRIEWALSELKRRLK